MEFEYAMLLKDLEFDLKHGWNNFGGSLIVAQGTSLNQMDTTWQWCFGTLNGERLYVDGEITQCMRMHVDR